MKQRIPPVDLSQKLIVGRDEVSIERLCAVMLFPDEPTDQRQYLFELDNPLGSSLHSQDEKPVAPNFAERILQGVCNGVLAGCSLMYFRCLSENAITSKARNRLDASQRSVSYLCKEFNLGRTDRVNGGDDSCYPTVSTKLAREVWKSYQSVAHLWAAYVHLRGMTVEARLGSHLLEDIDLSVLLFLARQYERFVVSFFDGEKSGRITRETVFPLRARYHDWSCDDVFAVDIPQPKGLKEFVEKKGAEYYPDA